MNIKKDYGTNERNDLFNIDMGCLMPFYTVQAVSNSLKNSSASVNINLLLQLLFCLHILASIFCQNTFKDCQENFSECVNRSPYNISLTLSSKVNEFFFNGIFIVR